MDALRCFVSRSPTLCEEYVPLLACALRSAKKPEVRFYSQYVNVGEGSYNASKFYVSISRSPK